MDWQEQTTPEKQPRKGKPHKRWTSLIGKDGLYFSERLKDLMENRNLTAKQVAAETGIPESAFSDYLKADRMTKGRDPSGTTIIVLARYFGVSTDYLFGLTAIKSPNMKKRTTSYLTGLTDEAISNIISLREVDLKRIEVHSTNSKYDKALREYLLIPTLDTLLKSPDFPVFLSLLTGYLVNRDAPMNAGGAIDPREYELGRRTVGAGESAELDFYRATQTLRQIFLEATVDDKETISILLEAIERKNAPDA